MAVDCGTELKRQGVVMLSLYPGAVKTELVAKLNETPRDIKSGSVKISFNSIFFDNYEYFIYSQVKFNVRKAFEKGETIEFAGKIIVGMAQDPNIRKLAGRVIIGADYAHQHNIRDIDNRVILSIRQVKAICDYFLPDSLKFVSQYIPGFLRIPQWMIDLVNSKF